MAENSEKKVQQKRGDRWFLITVLVVFLIGIGIRSYGLLTETGSQTRTLQQQSSSNYGSSSFAERDSGAKIQSIGGGNEEQGLLISLAPYLTEGGLSFFLGFCIGYFLRLVAKAAIFVIGAVYFCLILLSHYGIIAVDWGNFQHIVQHIFLNTQTHIEGLRDIITISLPSVAMGGIGIWRGLKKP
jgi:uncharacterized membrane protein (Fun14 family)